MNDSKLPLTLSEALELIRQQKLTIERQARRVAELEAELIASIQGTPQPKLGLKDLVRAIGFRSHPSKNDIEVLESSQLFDESFYRKQLVNRSDYKRGIKTPLKHYLTVGGFEGFDSCAEPFGLIFTT